MPHAGVELKSGTGFWTMDSANALMHCTQMQEQCFKGSLPLLFAPDWMVLPYFST